MGNVKYAILASLGLSACTHSVHLVHVSDFDGVASQKGKRIEARAEKFVVLHFAADTAYVDEAYRNLADQCRGGQVEGITTQYSTSHGFLSYTEKVQMRGLCVR